MIPIENDPIELIDRLCRERYAGRLPEETYKTVLFSIAGKLMQHVKNDHIGQGSACPRCAIIDEVRRFVQTGERTCEWTYRMVFDWFGGLLSDYYVSLACYAVAMVVDDIRVLCLADTRIEACRRIGDSEFFIKYSREIDKRLYDSITAGMQGELPEWCLYEH